MDSLQPRMYIARCTQTSLEGGDPIFDPLVVYFGDGCRIFRLGRSSDHSAATTVGVQSTGKFTERAIAQTSCARRCNAFAAEILPESVIFITGRSVTSVNCPDPSGFSVISPMGSSE